LRSIKTVYIQLGADIKDVRSQKGGGFVQCGEGRGVMHCVRTFWCKTPEFFEINVVSALGSFIFSPISNFKTFKVVSDSFGQKLKPPNLGWLWRHFEVSASL